jgi:hypothetical protein
MGFWWSEGGNMCIELLNIILTSSLTFLLIVSTIIISIKQYNLQKQLNKEHDILQADIARNNVKVSLYQNRMNCYTQIMQALDIMCGNDFNVFIIAIKDQNYQPVLDKLLLAKNLIFKSSVESEALFDINIVNFINEIYQKGNRFYLLTVELFTSVSKNRNTILENAKPEIHKLFSDIDNNDPIGDAFDKHRKLKSIPDSFQILAGALPGGLELLTIYNELNLMYKPNNDLFKSISNYVILENSV